MRPRTGFVLGASLLAAALLAPQPAGAWWRGGWGGGAATTLGAGPAAPVGGPPTDRAGVTTRRVQGQALTHASRRGAATTVMAGILAAPGPVLALTRA